MRNNVNQTPPDDTTADRTTKPNRLGFAVFFAEDGNISEELLIGLREAGYDGIEPNCYQVQHLYSVVELCRKVGLAIHAIPTGRWMNVDEASEDYHRYTQKAVAVLSEGAAIAASLDAPLIFGLIRGRASIADVQAEQFLSTVIRQLLPTIPHLKVLVEPIATAESAWPHTIGEGERFLRSLNQPRVKLLADSYHIVCSGEDPNIVQYRESIGHLHIRDHQKQIPTTSTPEYAAVYASIMRLWREQNLVLSFEPIIALDRTVENAIAGAQWIDTQTANLNRASGPR